MVLRLVGLAGSLDQHGGDVGRPGRRRGIGLSQRVVEGLEHHLEVPARVGHACLRTNEEVHGAFELVRHLEALNLAQIEGQDVDAFPRGGDRSLPEHAAELAQRQRVARRCVVADREQVAQVGLRRTDGRPLVEQTRARHDDDDPFGRAPIEGPSQKVEEPFRLAGVHAADALGFPAPRGVEHRTLAAALLQVPLDGDVKVIRSPEAEDGVFLPRDVRGEARVVAA